MRVDEIQAREDFLGVLAATLDAGWSTQHGRRVRVSLEPTAGAQPWRLQRLLSVLVSPPISSRARRFVADGFRYTPVRARAIPQWLLGTALASGPGLGLTAQPVLWVSPPHPSPEDVVILPGNRRVRVFDFRAGRCRVLLKPGYDPEPVLNEVAIRGAPRSGPFPPIVAWDPEGRWFEEPIVTGFALPRCPPWRDRGRHEREALRLLGGWLAATAEPVVAKARVDALLARVRARRDALAARFGEDLAARLAGAMSGLAGPAAALGATELARSHGDFQPGNVLVDVGADRVLLTDWEHTATRFRHYDALVWGLRSRFAAGLEARIEEFLVKGELRGEARGMLPGEAAGREWRAAALALFALEELAWIAEDGLSGPRSALSGAPFAIIAAAEGLARRPRG